jgi:hypothetical protein
MCSGNWAFGAVEFSSVDLLSTGFIVMTITILVSPSELAGHHLTSHLRCCSDSDNSDNKTIVG